MATEIDPERDSIIPPGDSKPKTCSGVFRDPFRFASPADLEDPGQVVVVDASTLVGDGEPRLAIGSPQR